MIHLGSVPHLRLYTPSFSKLPLLGYLTLDRAGPGDFEHFVSSARFSGQPVPPALLQWAAQNRFPVPAIRFKVEAAVRGGKYIVTRRPTFAFGLLKQDAIKTYQSLPNIQHLWIPALWALTGCPPKNWVLPIYTECKNRKLRSTFTQLKDITSSMAPHQKILVAMQFLARYWHNNQIRTKGAEHLIQLKLIDQLGPNNFVNYLAEAGLRRMADSQIERLWAKLVNASAQVEKFRALHDAQTRRKIRNFIAKHKQNPFIFSLLSSAPVRF